MRFAINLLGSGGEAKARAIQDIFRSVARYYRVLRLAYPLPPLYQSGIQFGVPPFATIDGHQAEDLLDPWTVLRRGYGDCDQLCLYRATELSDNQFQPRIYWRKPSFHIALWRPDLEVCEDPSLILLGRQHAPEA